MVPLLFILGSDSHRAVVVDRPTVIGRSRRCEIRLDSQSVSRRHAELQWVDGTAWINDLGSRNGTFVNGRRIGEPTKLHVGDRVRVGDIKLNYRVVAQLPQGLEPIAGTGDLKGMLTFKCGPCGARLGAKLDMIRSVHVCPRCGATLIVPELPGATPPPQAPTAEPQDQAPRFDPDYREESGAALEVDLDIRKSQISEEEAASVLGHALRGDDDDDDEPQDDQPQDSDASASVSPPTPAQDQQDAVDAPPAQADAEAPLEAPEPVQRDQTPAPPTRAMAPAAPLPVPKVNSTGAGAAPAEPEPLLEEHEPDGGLPRHVQRHEEASQSALDDVLHNDMAPRQASPVQFGEDEAALELSGSDAPRTAATPEAASDRPSDAQGVAWWNPAHPVQTPAPRDSDELVLSLTDPEDEPVAWEGSQDGPSSSLPGPVEAVTEAVQSGPPSAEPLAQAAPPPARSDRTSDDAVASATAQDPVVSASSEPVAQAANLPLVSEGRGSQELLAGAEQASAAVEAADPEQASEPRGAQRVEEPTQSPTPLPGREPRAEAFTVPIIGDEPRQEEPVTPVVSRGAVGEARIEPAPGEVAICDLPPSRRQSAEHVEVRPQAEAQVLPAPGRTFSVMWTRPAKGRDTDEPAHIALAHQPPRPLEPTETVALPGRWHVPANAPLSAPWRQGAEAPGLQVCQEPPHADLAQAPGQNRVIEPALQWGTDLPAPLAPQPGVDDQHDDHLPPQLSVEHAPTLARQPVPHDGPSAAAGRDSGAESPADEVTVPAAAPAEAALLAPERMQAGQIELPRAMAWWDAATLPQTQAIILAWLESRRDVPAERPARSSHTQPESHADDQHWNIRSLPQIAQLPQAQAFDDRKSQRVEEEDWWATPIVREHVDEEDSET